MLYESVENTLQRTVDRLLKGNDAQSWWDAHTDYAEMCLAELDRMSNPAADVLKRSDERCTFDPRRRNLQPAILHVRNHVQNMVAAMRKRDRAAALKSGREALAELPPR